MVRKGQITAWLYKQSITCGSHWSDHRPTQSQDMKCLRILNAIKGGGWRSVLLPPKILGGGQNPNTGDLNVYQDKTPSS